MIFVTIGTQEPFDRLIKAIDEITPVLNGVKIIAQVHKGGYKPRNFETFEFIPPAQFEKYFNEARLIIAHAGMGSIISALTLEKPILVMPRLSEFNEHRNDHQLATAQRFEKLRYVHVVYDEHALPNKLISILEGDLKPLHQIGEHASQDLIESIHGFINS